jgi:hypothetical protein
MKMAGWKHNNGRLIFVGNSLYKAIFYGVSLLIFLFVSFVVYQMFASVQKSSMGDTIAGCIVLFVLLVIAWGLFRYASYDDKYIDINKRFLYTKQGNSWRTIRLSDIDSIIGIDQYINGRYHGKKFVYLLNGQTEAPRRTQEVSHVIFNKQEQETFYVAFMSLLKA